MDLTNARSMEFFRFLGLADGLRAQGVPSDTPYTVRISTGLNEKENLTAWYLDSVDKYRERIVATNDGTLPLEPYQRLSQTIFEAWLKGLAEKDSFITLNYGSKVESVEETVTDVSILVSDNQTGEVKKITSRYLAACDGAGSRVRRTLSIPLDGGPVPMFALLVHFKSRDLTRLHKQGQFWHIFFLGGGAFRGAIVAQDEKDTWTTQLMLPLDADPDLISDEEAVFTVLGGMGEKYPIKIDKVLVRSIWRPSIAVAREYISPKGSIYLAGDSAHQNNPTGGYGMNMGLGDAFDLGWKLATVINGHGGPSLLKSYEQERRPVALRTIERSGVHQGVHVTGASIMSLPHDQLTSAAGEVAKEKIRIHYAENDGENQDLGVEMDLRYKSPICVSEPSDKEPSWIPSAYTPSTYPGSRAPHVFLNDGTALFDRYGKYYSLIVFSQGGDTGKQVQLLKEAAEKQTVPLELITLVGEDNAYKVWGEIPMVITRPDGHVSWRGQDVEDISKATKIMNILSGKAETETNGFQYEKVHLKQAFTSTVGIQEQGSDYKLERMGEFQH